ncbi:hypothetical protein O9929_24485 [Vibrio lentus]|nr:hypothetical protein [Vibrio lentus]
MERIILLHEILNRLGQDVQLHPLENTSIEGESGIQWRLVNTDILIAKQMSGESKSANIYLRLLPLTVYQNGIVWISTSTQKKADDVDLYRRCLPSLVHYFQRH